MQTLKPRFTTISVDQEENDTRLHIVVKDNETGVLYYRAESAWNRDAGIGLTPLLGADGKPIIDK